MLDRQGVNQKSTIPGWQAALNAERVRIATSVLPIMIGARDVSFPRLNLISWYFFIAGALLVIISLFTGNGPPDAVR